MSVDAVVLNQCSAGATNMGSNTLYTLCCHCVAQCVVVPVVWLPLLLSGTKRYNPDSAGAGKFVRLAAAVEQCSQLAVLQSARSRADRAYSVY